MRKEGGSTRKKTRFGLVIQALVLVLSEVMEDSEPGRDEIGHVNSGYSVRGASREPRLVRATVILQVRNGVGLDQGCGDGKNGNILDTF